VLARAFDQTLRSVLVLAFHVALAGCAASELFQPDTSTGEAVSQTGFRRLVAENMSKIFSDPGSLGDVEISGPRMVDHNLNGRAWLTCLKVEANGKPQYYAVFISGDKIVDSRAGIIMDRCHKETYSPFDIAQEAAPFKLPREPKNSKPRAAAVPVR
jgi:hypothetical protein